MMKELVIGDIHGRNKELNEVLKLAGFNKEEDKLIVLGDILDYGPDFIGVIKTLNSIKNKILIRGNHDWWFQQYLLGKPHPLMGQHGSAATLNQWLKASPVKKQMVRDFMDTMVDFHLENKNLFVHAGIIPEIKVEDHQGYVLRETYYLVDLIMESQGNDKLKTVDDINEIFIGHVPTLRYRKIDYFYAETDEWTNVELNPINLHNVWLMDTGAKFSKYGRLTIMDINTHEFFQQPIL